MSSRSVLGDDFVQLSHVIRERDSIPQQVAGGLRKLIMTGKLKPGQRIVERELARQLGIGQPTAREALKILEAEGIILRHPNRGCTVTHLSSTEIDQIFRMRIALETLVVDLVMDNRERLIAAKPQLEAEVNSLRRAAQETNVEDFYRSALEFRRVVWGCADNPFVTNALSQITRLLYTFAVLRHAKDLESVLSSATTEYERVVHSFLTEDRERAKQAVRVMLENFWNLTRPLTAQSDITNAQL